MSIRFNTLSSDEITDLIESLDPKVRVNMSSLEAAEFLKYPLPTIYTWVHDGFLNGTFRKRGKRLNFLTRRLIEKSSEGAKRAYGVPTLTLAIIISV